MGFDSLFLTQASLAIEKKLNVRVAFRQLLEELSTLDALAAHIDATLPPDASAEGMSQSPQPAVIQQSEVTAPLHPVATEGHANDFTTVPLTEAQRELWFASQMSDASSCAFNECRLLHLRGSLRQSALLAAMQLLVDRHESLRTHFSPTGDWQSVHPTMKLDIPVIDWSKLETGEHVSRLDAVMIEEARETFDLVGGPLLRARLIRLSEMHHVMVLTIHHIVCDGHSFGILARELGELYSAECRGVRSPLPAPLQLGDYAREQTRRQTSAERAADEAYWLKQFSDSAPMLELPTDRPRPSAWTFEGARECRALPAPLGQELKRVSAQRGGTLFTTLLAAYSAFLHRLTGQKEIVVGIPVADRAMHGSTTLVGHCVNFLPERATLNGDETFVEHLAITQKKFLDAHEHQRYTFGSLIQKLELSRDQSRMPLVSVTFNVERMSEDLKFFGLETVLAANPHGSCNFDLGFNLTEIPGALLLDCRYNTSLFDAQTIQRWLGHFQTFLEGIAPNPQQLITELPLLAADERRRILVEWNNTHADFPRDKCVHQLFEEQVERTPDAVAAVFNSESLTYSELNERADRLARQLRALNVGPDVPVGLCVERSLEMLVAVLAVLKAGGAYVPLDPAYPKERLGLMLENSRVPLVLTQRTLRDNFKFEAQNCKVLCLEEVYDALRDSSGKPRSRSTNLAYVIHTSGSTGVPKGVAIEHRSAVNFIHWAQRVFTREELAGVLFSTSICFDLSVFELFVTLSSGGKVIIAQNAIELPNLPSKNEVTLINTVPSAAAELLRMNAIPASVTVVNLAGEPLKPALVDKLYAVGTVQKVYDLYGPSETTTYSTCALRRRGAPATVGRPIANTEIYLLDQNLQPVPVGVIGEIYIGGEGVARGYLHRPDLTAERFIPNPFNNAVGARLYKTGDVARWLPDGNIQFLGRTDHQVKIRGHRIELGEIESALTQHPAVRESVVTAREDAPDEKRLAAYVVAEPDKASAAPGMLRDFLLAKLPDYMIPSAFVFLDALPLTPNGKVNRRALPAPEQVHPELQDTYAVPGTPTEKALAEIWREVLCLERVGVHDNFFELGGQSLLMTRVITRVRESFQVELPMRRFFESATIAELAVTMEGLLVDEISQLSEDEARRMAHSTS
ncbi:MAG: amino acid adenylation domain-containing protein [Verrucomicrobia bacterium]|nr:amino acid adenylation domain-containing protein [Verrucomicrobiota bacterium]